MVNEEETELKRAFGARLFFISNTENKASLINFILIIRYLNKK